jgi:hypothetical protein
MADNVSITAGSGTTIAADDVGSGILVQRVKSTWGPDGTANDTDVASGKPLPSQLRHSNGTILSDATGLLISTSQLAILATTAQPIATGGQLVTLPTDVGVPVYAASANFVSGTTAAMTGTTTTSLLAAPAAGLRNYITQITVSNSHATVGTDVLIQDGSGGTTLYVIPAAAVYGGAVLTFPVPLRQPTTATAIFCANVTTGASTKVSASGYKGA